MANSLKFADNLPVTFKFKTVHGKEFASDKYKNKDGTPQISFGYYVLDPTEGLVEKSLYAKPYWHDKIQQLQPNTTSFYTILLEKKPGDKYSKFNIFESDASGKRLEEEHHQVEDESEHSDNELEDFLARDDQTVASTSRAPEKNVKSSKDPQSVAWAIKCAVNCQDAFWKSTASHSGVDLVEVLGKGNYFDNVKFVATKFLEMHQELMSE